MAVLEHSTAAQRTLVRAPLADVIILAARVLIALIFIMSGFEKLVSYQAAAGHLEGMGVPAVFAYLAPPVEFLCGVAVLLGALTEAAAAVMFIFTIVTTLTAHRYWQYADPAQYVAQYTNFWKNVSMMGGMLLLIVTAGGRYSVDALMRRGRT
jgi:putative oxidoreductase